MFCKEVTPIFYQLPPEDDLGNIEYKWDLSKMNKYKHHKTTSQMKWRVCETATINSALYVLGVYDDGKLTGISKGNLIKTYLNLMDCAHSAGLYTCIRQFKKIPDTDCYWAVLQVYAASDKNKIRCDSDIPSAPDHPLPNYLCL